MKENNSTHEHLHEKGHGLGACHYERLQTASKIKHGFVTRRSRLNMPCLHTNLYRQQWET